MRKHVLALLLAAIVLTGVSATTLLRAPKAHAYSECTDTAFYNYGSEGIDGPYNGHEVYVWLQVARDIHDLAYCGWVRTRVDWSIVYGCDTIYASVYLSAVGEKSINSVYTCSHGGTVYSHGYITSGSTAVIGDGYDQADVGTFSGNWFTP